MLKPKPGAPPLEQLRVDLGALGFVREARIDAETLRLDRAWPWAADLVAAFTRLRALPATARGLQW